MNRIIKNYTNITEKHIALITDSYPEGFGDDDLTTLSMPDGKYLRCLEVRTEDTIYLFRIDSEMIEKLEEATDSDFDIDLDEAEISEE
ncbi:MAG: hypothetical protein ISQ97_06600 [Flavobacteriales bacterium]|jgi:hypothetical protein|nr:hypothetical protein [Flavobacteriales bacterium]